MLRAVATARGPAAIKSAATVQIPRRAFHMTPISQTAKDGTRWRSGRIGLREAAALRTKEVTNEAARRRALKELLETKDIQGTSNGNGAPADPARRTSALRAAFVEQLKPLELHAQPVLGASSGGGSGGSGRTPGGSRNNSDEPGSATASTPAVLDPSTSVVASTEQTGAGFVERAFDPVILSDIQSTVLAGLVRRSHMLLYAEDPWSEAYSVELLSDTARRTGAQLTAIDIPDWAVLTARIDPVLEDLTIVSHPYSPPPDLDTSGSGDAPGRSMPFFAGIARKKFNDEGDSLSEQVERPQSPEGSPKSLRSDEDDVDGIDNERDSDSRRRVADRVADAIRASFSSGSGRGGSGERLDAADEDASGEPVLSREMMTNPLSREATEKLDRVLTDFVTLQTGDPARPRILAIKHLGDLLNTRIGYTLFTRLAACVAKHNANAESQPVMVVGLLHPSWFHMDTPPPGLPPFDVNPSTPVALAPSADRGAGLERNMNSIVEGLLGEDMHNAVNGRLGVQVVQVGGSPGSGRLPRALGGLSGGGSKHAKQQQPEELPLFARVGIPPPNNKVMAEPCDMRVPEFASIGDAEREPVIGSLRQSMVADQCLDRNARVIRNICLLYRIPGLQLTADEAAHLSKLTGDEADGGTQKVLFERKPLFYESDMQVILKQQARAWHLDHRPLLAMLRCLPDDTARRYFFGETFLHRWVSLAHAAAIKETLTLEHIKSDPSILIDGAQKAVLGSRHLRQAWTQLIDSHVALRHGVLGYPQDKQDDARQIDFGEIGVGRKVEDDYDVVLPPDELAELVASAAPKVPAAVSEEGGAATRAEASEKPDVISVAAADSTPSYTEWSEVGSEHDGMDEDVGDADSAAKTPASVPSAKKRIQQAKKQLNEYEQRLVGSIVDPQSIPTGFSQVCVQPETVTTLQEIITLPMLRPEYFSQGVLKRHGVSGILLFGPPGTGKTMLAKAVAKESGSVVLNIRASDVYDKYVGEGEKLAEAVFTLARKLAPCVVFIDEVDALFSARSSGEPNKFRRDVMNQIMAEWDGMNTSRGNASRVMVMAATNRPFDLDDAILRRLPRRILVDLPGEKERAQILEIHLTGEAMEEGVDLAAISGRTQGFSGSDLKNLCVAAALAALRERVRQEVGENGSMDKLRATRAVGGTISLGMRHFEQALKKVAASSSDQMESLVELRKWDKIYGDGAQERKRTHTIGFAGQPAEEESKASKDSPGLGEGGAGRADEDTKK